MVYPTTCGLNAVGPQPEQPKTTFDEIIQKTHESNKEVQSDQFYRELYRLEREMSVAIKVLAEKIDELSKK